MNVNVVGPAQPRGRGYVIALIVRHIIDADGHPPRWPPRSFIVIPDAAQRLAEAVS
jgi:hypothetical protein